jgi:DNA-binding CsgD family transcriptional regulator
MAAMLGISAETIKKTRQRLRKKIGLEESMGLEEWIEQELAN